jgi:hypothetical protein
MPFLLKKTRSSGNEKELDSGQALLSGCRIKLSNIITQALFQVKIACL